MADASTVQTPQDRAPGPARLHDVDGLRAILMILVCVGHVLLMYAHGPEYFITSPDKSSIVTALAALLTVFHMPAFFLLAGFFTVRSLGRKPVADWLAGRARRLLIPMLTGIVLVSPLAILAATLAVRGPMPGPVANFSPDYVTSLLVFDSRWLGHLWFLPCLFVLSAMTAGLAAMRLLTPIAAGAAGVISRIPPAPGWLGVVALGAVWTTGVIASVRVLAGQGVPVSLLAGAIDLRNIAVYALPFALGVVMALHPVAMSRLTQVSIGRVAVSAALGVALVMLWTASDTKGLIAKTLVEGALSLSATFLALSAARALLVRPSQVLSELSALSMSIYIVHYPIAALLGVAFQPVNWPAELETLLIACGMLGMSVGLAMAIRRIGLLDELFNGTLGAMTRVGGEAKGR
jgi:glucan biosynthesis protein C